jgi:Mn-dependent DtxR family transcriptional regulator
MISTRGLDAEKAKNHIWRHIYAKRAKVPTTDIAKELNLSPRIVLSHAKGLMRKGMAVVSREEVNLKDGTTRLGKRCFVALPSDFKWSC